MEQVYRTSHFSLERRVADQGKGYIGFFVLDPDRFDLVEEMGFGIGEPLPLGYNIEAYTERLERARTEEEKDKILCDLYFVMSAIADYFC